MLWILYALLSAIFLSMSEIFQKRGLFKEHALEFTTAKEAFSMLFVLVLIPFIDFNFPKITWLLVFGLSVTGSIGILLRAKAYRHMQISSVAPFFNLSPALVALFAFIFLNENLSLTQFAGITVLMVGAYVLEVDHNVHSLLDPFKKFFHSKYITYIFIVMILFSFTAIIDKTLIDFFLTPLQFIFLVHVFLTINFLTITLFMYGRSGLVNSFKTGKKDAFFSSLFFNLDIFFYYMALSVQLVSMVVPIKRLSTIFTTIGGGTIFKDKGLYLKAVACIIMFIGAYLIIK